MSGVCNIRNDVELDEYLGRLYSNSKFKNWGIDKGDMREELQKIDYPITFRDILPTALGLYFGDSFAEIWIYKNNLYRQYIESLLKIFPGSKFIFITRDPRAIYNSQRISIDSITSKPMVSNCADFVHIYIKAMR